MVKVHRHYLILLTVYIFLIKPAVPSQVKDERKSGTYKLRFTKAICIDLPYEVAWNVTCRLKLYRDQPSKMLFSITVDRIDHLYLAFTMFYKYQVTYQPLLMETTFDVCNYLKQYKKRAHIGAPINLDQTALFVLQLLEKNNPAAIRNGCPYSGVIAFDNFIIDESMSPSFIPAGNYRLDMRYFNEKNQTVMHSQVFGSVRAVGIADLSMG